MQSLKLSLPDALDIFEDSQSDIASACQSNTMHVIRSHQPAYELDPEKEWTKEDIHAAVNKHRIAEGVVNYVRTMNAITRRNAPSLPGRITPEMIDRAREYPVEELIEFKRGLSHCLWHNDTNASLSWDKKRNRVHCFPCEKDANSIDIIMAQDSCSFPVAVKKLCR